MNALISNVKNFFGKYKVRRFIAFLIDAAIVFVILMARHGFSKFPDIIYMIRDLQDAAKIAAPGTIEAQQAANVMFTAFNSLIYIPYLFIWFGYEIISALILRGATIGKLICRLKIVSMKQTDGAVIVYLRIALRGAVKGVFCYVFSMIPFLISALSIFANDEHRAGIDFFAGTKVIDTRNNR